MTTNGKLRPTLGDFNSIVCFRAIVVGMEETLGERAANVALKAAGRKRGEQLVRSLGLHGAKTADTGALAKALDEAVGASGTRLCAVARIEREGDLFRVYLSETICSADEPPGSPRELTFTFGAVQGAIESIFDLKLRGRQTGSILRGADHDIIEFEPR